MFVIKQQLKSNLVLLLATILLCTAPLIASSELAMVPFTETEESGYLEFGTFIDQNRTTLDDEIIDVPVLSYFMRYGLTKDIEYNLKVRHDMKTLHSVHLGMFNFTTHNGRAKHSVGTGLKNFGWVFPSSEEITDIDRYSDVNIPVISGYSTYAVASSDGDSGVYVGLGNDVDKTGTTLIMGGLEKQFGHARLLLEYDGKLAHLGIKASIKNYNIIFGYAIGSQEFTSDEVQTSMWSFGLSYGVNQLDHYKNMFATRNEIDGFKSDLRVRMEKIERLIEEDQVLRESRFLEDLEDSLTKALTGQEDEREEDLTIKRAFAHMQKGLELYYAGKFRESLKEYHTAVKIMPDSHFGHMRIGSIYYQLRNYEQAKYHWEIAYELDPTNNELAEQIKSLMDPEAIKEFEERQLKMEENKDPSDLTPDKARLIKLRKIKDIFKGNE